MMERCIFYQRFHWTFYARLKYRPVLLLELHGRLDVGVARRLGKRCEDPKMSDELGIWIFHKRNRSFASFRNGKDTKHQEEKE